MRNLFVTLYHPVLDTTARFHSGSVRLWLERGWVDPAEVVPAEPAAQPELSGATSTDAPDQSEED